MLNYAKDIIDSCLDLESIRDFNLILKWYNERRLHHIFKTEQIPFSKLKSWHFNEETGNLQHETGQFFSIEGVHIETNWGRCREWEQPIINQPEIGFLGFITQRIRGLLHFLVQAKMEPGNINQIQFAPTLQATRSNFTCAHKGKKPPYLEYFQDLSGSSVIVDSLQSEQGARFFRKRNRNIIIEVPQNVEIYDDFHWMTLGQIFMALKHHNLVNMDTRTVLSCLAFGDETCSIIDKNLKCINQSLLNSLSPNVSSMHSNEQILSWFTEQKFRYELYVDRIPLKLVKDWVISDVDIRHISGQYFSVIACSVNADNREVKNWTQPIIKPHQRGLVAFVIKNFNDVTHFLVQAKVEPGNFDVVEMAPTVQCMTGNVEQVETHERPPFVDYVLKLPRKKALLDTLQSEEGGRFYQEENRNLIVWADADFPKNIPDNYIWMTARQLKEFIKYNNYVNVQARCLLASLNFFEGIES